MVVVEESGRLGEGKGTFCALEVEEMYICMVSYVMVVVESDKLGDQGATKILMHVSLHNFKL